MLGRSGRTGCLPRERAASWTTAPTPSRLRCVKTRRQTRRSIRHTQRPSRRTTGQHRPRAPRPSPAANERLDLADHRPRRRRWATSTQQDCGSLSERAGVSSPCRIEPRLHRLTRRRCPRQPGPARRRLPATQARRAQLRPVRGAARPVVRHRPGRRRRRSLVQPVPRPTCAGSPRSPAPVLLIAVVVTVLVGTRLVRPLRALTEAARQPGRPAEPGPGGHPRRDRLPGRGLQRPAERRDRVEEQRRQRWSATWRTSCAPR